ncbi:MAG: AraC family transcriptional regulator [Desulfobacteraceae bacterium]|nr:AraC family transcriptional regulator [Desulfobacteraceae bacterium]
MQSIDTIIDHRQRIRRVMIHIGQHLEKKLRLDQLAEIACFSSFHFIRVFETIMGETPQQYIIRKRMERAGFYLLKKDLRITDVAFSVAYGTPSSFCKVFKTHFGISPRKFQDTISEDCYYKTNHPFRSVTLNCNQSLPTPLPIIRSLPPIKAMYIVNKGVVNGSFLATAKKSFNRFEKLIAYHGLEGSIKNQISIYPNRASGLEDDQALNFVGAVVEQKIDLVNGLHYYTFPPGKYAIFKHYGSYDFIMQTWNQAYINWFPKSGRLLRDEPPLEIHLNATTSNKFQLKAYLLIPIL